MAVRQNQKRWSPPHSYLFPAGVLRQPSQPPGFPSGPEAWNGYPSAYEMDARVVNDPLYRERLPKALLALPSLSVVCARDDLFGQAAGLYLNSTESGDRWERACSAEVKGGTIDAFSDMQRAVRGRGSAGSLAVLSQHLDVTQFIDYLLLNYYAARTKVLLRQLRAAQLYPTVPAPTLKPHGGPATDNLKLTMATPAGSTICYTTNGVDPRSRETGLSSPQALVYTGPVTIGLKLTVKARALITNAWSALVQAEFTR